MHHDQAAAIIANDLDSLIHRIEALPAHPAYTDALNGVTEACAAIKRGRSEVHQRETAERHRSK